MLIELFKSYSKKIVRRFVGYVEDGILYQIVEQSGRDRLVKADENFQPKILVVGRDAYTEETVFYNIEDTREVKNILALQESEDDAFTLLKVENKIRVTKWHYREAIDDSVLAFCKIPVSFLLAENNEKGNIFESDTLQGASLFILDGPTGLESTLLQENGFVNSREAFAMSVGVPIDEFEQPHKKLEIVEQVFLAFSSGRLIKKLVLPFINFDGVFAPKSLLNLVTPVALGVACYFSITSSYLFWKDKQIETQTDEMSSSAQQSIELKNMASDLALKAKKATADKNLNQPNASKSILIVLNLMDTKNIQLSRVVMYNGRYVLRGSAAKATDVLTKLNENPMVSDAKFDAEVIKKYLKEDFVVSFTVNSK